MKYSGRRPVCGFLLTIAFAWCANAQNQAVPEDVRAFAARYVAAINAKDATRIRAMYNSQSLACITPQTKDFYDAVMPVHSSDHVPADYTVSLLPVNEDNLKALADSETFPVKPLNELHIDYQQGEESGTVIIWLARENGRWVGDFPCATEKALKQYREEAPQRREIDAHYKALADGIQQPLRGELIAMLRDHKRSSALTRYREASGQDYKTSIYVINDLVEQLDAH
ncbi:MAG: hypothetical protein ABR973_05975 [Candidatus Acidiferrales bacterium]|jgi:hypothetical protein